MENLDGIAQSEKIIIPLPTGVDVRLIDDAQNGEKGIIIEFNGDTNMKISLVQLMRQVVMQPYGGKLYDSLDNDEVRPRWKLGVVDEYLPPICKTYRQFHEMGEFSISELKDDGEVFNGK